MRPFVLIVAAAMLGIALQSFDLEDARRAAATGGVTQVDVGGYHACAVTGAGAVVCWGTNVYGQLGNGTDADSEAPVQVCETGAGLNCPALDGIVQVAAGRFHTCGLTVEHNVRCWGRNNTGQLGDGTTSGRMNPVTVCANGSGPACDPLEDVASIAAGAGHTCALLQDGGIKCWGDNGSGRLGNPNDETCGPFTCSRAPVSVCETFVVILSPNPSGGDGIPCGPLGGFTAVAAGYNHTCALLEVGGIKCWGSNNSGQLGNGTEIASTEPVDVCHFAVIPLSAAGIPIDPTPCLTFTTFDGVTAGNGYSCGTTEFGMAMCWGDNSNGKLGDGTTIQRTTPVDVCATGSGQTCGEIDGVTAIDAGGQHTCLVTSGRAACWGENAIGQLGSSTYDSDPRPAIVVGLEQNVTAALAGIEQSTCGIQNERVKCWGAYPYGATSVCGADDIPCSNVPLEIPGLGPKQATATPTSTAVGPTNTPTNTPPGPTNTPTNTPEPGGTVGDVNCDGNVNAIDAAFLLQLLAGLVDHLPCPQNADVNQDGNTNAVDAALILQYSAGLIGTLPP